MKTDAQTLSHAAARWRTLQDLGLSQAQREELDCWLRANPSHVVAFRDIDRTWDQLDQVHGTTADAAIEADLQQFRRGQRRATILRFAAPLAAAAAFALVYISWWRPTHYATTAMTSVGKVIRRELPDGSTVQLNTDTMVEVRFSPSERRIRLARGEAHFSVAKNPSRPFVVVANGIEVRAVGTAFNVRLRERGVEVLVTEGRVRLNEPPVSPAASSPAHADSVAQLLVAGECAVVSLDASASPAARVSPASVSVASLPPAEIDRMLAWHDRRLVFVSAPLSEIVTEFNRYNTRKLTIADPKLGSRRFGGTFQANEPETFIEMLRTSELVVEERDDHIVLRAAAK